MHLAHRLMAVYITLIVVVTGLYMSIPETRTPLWAVIGLSGVAAVLTGVHIHRPAQRWPWWALAGGLLTFIAGDTSYNVLEEYFHASNPFPSPRTRAISPPIRSSRRASSAWSGTAGRTVTCPACWTR